MKIRIILCFFISLPLWASAQRTDAVNNWFMYFGSHRFQDSKWGIHTEAQYRNHNLAGDLDQLLLRYGLQYHLPKAGATVTLGAAFIENEPEGKSKVNTNEWRSYQELMLIQTLSRFVLVHRYRYEQRWIENANFRTRYRYALFVNICLNKPVMEQGTTYLALYNEIFINGIRPTAMPYFDRNRAYVGVGHRLNGKNALQVGVMDQATNDWTKLQLQFSWHHNMTLGRSN